MPKIEFIPEFERDKSVAFRAERIDPATGIRGSQTLVFLPKSQINWTHRGDTWVCAVPAWLYADKNLALLAPVSPVHSRR